MTRRHQQQRFRLLAAQSDLGRALYQHFGLDPVNYDTYVLLQDGEAHFRSEASIHILAGLGGVWSLLAKSASPPSAAAAAAIQVRFDPPTLALGHRVFWIKRAPQQVRGRTRHVHVHSS